MEYCRTAAGITEKIPNAAVFSQIRTTLEDCREELREVLEEWALFRVQKNLPLPAIDGIELVNREVA